MLIIDGNTTTGNPRFWRAGNTGAGITTLTIGTTYRFSYWIKSVSSLVTGPSSQADIGVQIAGVTPTLVSGSTLAPLPSSGWRHVVYSFIATATTATIELWNNNTSASGNEVVALGGDRDWGWGHLRNFNFFIENCTDEAVPESVRNHFIGLARFFRAFFYFEKVLKVESFNV